MSNTTPDYTLGHRAEILAVLDRLHDEHVPMSVGLGCDRTLVTRVIEVRRDADALVFDISGDADANRALFAAASLSFVTELDSVQIAFETRAPALTSLFDGPAALVALPPAITRLQRRESFRAALPTRPPIRCTVLGPNGEARPAKAIDLSCGGVSVVVDDTMVGDNRPGSGHALVVSLPDVGPVAMNATLRTVRNTDDIGEGTDPAIRLGFRFEHLPAKTASQIQRYVQRLEVEQLRISRMRDRKA